MRLQTLSFFKRSLVATALLLSVFILGCSTGENAFREGDYTEAARLSADRLSRNANNQKAAEVFLRAYPQAREEWLGKLKLAKADLTDPFRFERIVLAYETLQDLSTLAAMTPYAGKKGIEINYYHAELEGARLDAAQARESAGDELMASGDLYQAREAHYHYEVALRYVGSRQDLQQKLSEALRQGTLWVGVDEVVGEGHGVNPTRLATALIEVLQERPIHQFVRFVPSSQLGEYPASRYLELSIGELSLSRTEREVGKQEFSRIVNPSANANGADPIEVFAKLYKREKAVSATCPVKLRIFSGPEGEAVYIRSFVGRSKWSARWDLLEGDQRAVEGQELEFSEPEDPEFVDMADLLALSIAEETRDLLSRHFRDS
ncbi:hypothetical protein [Pelagicoccus albus]|uniref:Uncharacterized protein n=1 Tax=Pelagicoccus albus TaxID=415222 RepID=A0A7X1E919_9BACT|nr:hypothetical protein [Pelagicoccus albus]MBC2606738.1 hypothetical protein [Pelagicoccus albus]